MPRETSAGAVIFRKENNKTYYLLLHYGAGHWGFPKGHIEGGEKEEDTARREVKEETGLENIRVLKGFKEYTKYAFRDIYGLKKNPRLPSASNGKRGGQARPQRLRHSRGGQEEKAPWVFKIVTFLLAETRTKEVKISFEHTDFKWLPYEEALKQLSFKKVKESQ